VNSYNDKCPEFHASQIHLEYPAELRLRKSPVRKKKDLLLGLQILVIYNPSRNIPMVDPASLRFLYSFLYSKHIKLIQVFGFLPLPYPSLAQPSLSVTHVHNIAAFVLGLHCAYEGEHAAFGLLSPANFA
jgi:hypothetical protein